MSMRVQYLIVANITMKQLVLKTRSALPARSSPAYKIPAHSILGLRSRDYVHVEDVARGVLNSIELLETTGNAHVFNLGGKRGYSNLEIINTINKMTPLQVDLKYGDPRPGDPSTLVADATGANTHHLYIFLIVILFLL